MAAQLPALNLIAPPGQRRATLDLARETERCGFAGISVSCQYSNMAQCLGLAFATERIAFATASAPIYAQKCALCHGENGVNPAPGVLPLVGPSKFDRIDTMKTVPYYKYATTLFDVTRRSMPFPAPKTLTNDELYALSAYILSLNKIIGEDEVMDAKTLPQVKMPNQDNFIVWDPDTIGYVPIRSQGPAMR